ncbi:MAG: thiamine ABC transporter ATP-binding protein [Mesorhizobium sp.]|jgi:thiamine transport system ATP-binding protein|nr:thiamine ABC transporter ATP-binding protein [Mesorhizobium sp.]
MDRPVSAKTGADVRLDRVAFSYGEASMEFDLAIEAGSITAIMGPSGSGKSTLLNLVAGFASPQSGRILISGADVTDISPSERPVSMVFQENNLFAHLDVAANVGLGRSPALRLTPGDRTAVTSAISRTGLSGKEKRLPRELSGGERQRVALARVLVRDRPVLLLDEPFASLGPALRQDMLDLVKALHAERRMTILFVTHQPDDARWIASRIVFLENGHVVAAGETEEFFGRHGPEAFKRYVGDNVAQMHAARGIARKPT